MHRSGRSVALSLLAALAVATAGFAVVAPAGADPAIPTGPAGDAFYTPPDPLPKAKPGTLIRAQPIAAPKGVPAGGQAWNILYHSRTVAGRDIAVSGVVAVPAGPAPKGGRPVLSWAHGTAGLADTCAPTRIYAGNLEVLIPFSADLLAQGFVIVSTDYEGLGTPGVPPFLVGESEGRNVLDAARAARQVPGAAGSKRVVLGGQSEGGHGSLFAGELARKYAPELKVLGVQASAPAADISLIVPLALSIPSAAGYGVMALLGFHSAYPQADVAAVLTPEAVARSAIADTACSRDVLASFAAGPQPIVANDPKTTEPWASLLKKSAAGNRPTTAPLLVLQGDADRTLPKSFADMFVASACAVGDTVDYRVYPGADHNGALLAGKADYLAWLAARVNGDPPTPTC